MRSLACMCFVAAILAAACGSTAAPAAVGPPPSETPTVVVQDSVPVQADSERLRTGFAISPRSYTGSDLPDFLAKVRPQTDVLMHAGDWAELAQPESPFDVFTELAQDQGLAAAMVISPSAGGELIRPLDPTTRADYLRWLRRFLTDRQPEYVGLANEVNMLALDDPAGFASVVDLWVQALPIVRELAPNAQVFVTFQYERTIGRHDGWFGGSTVAADWSVLNRFPGMDIAAFTTYPSLVVDDPAELADDYYAPIVQHTDLPIVFTEIGWSADEALAVLPGSEQEQVDYIDILEHQACDLDVELLVWTFVYGDLVTEEPFRAVDLHRDDGTPRPAWDRWTSLEC